MSPRKFDYKEEREKQIFSELNELYQKVPKVKCQGHCSPFCSAIGMESIELMNIERNHKKFPQGFENPVDQGQTIRCGALDSENQCTVYDSRPMICRMFGAAQMMLQCPIGCELEDDGQRLSPEQMMGLLLEVKLLNAKLNVPTTYHRIIRKLESQKENESLDLEKELPEAYYNVPRELWERDMESEELKTKYTLCSSQNISIENLDMDKYFEAKKWRVVKSITQALSDKTHRGTINIINADNGLQMEFKREELENLSGPEIYEKVFNPSDSDIEKAECSTCHSKGFKKYLDKNTCQFCEGEF